jgi:hypothetical protein
MAVMTHNDVQSRIAERGELSQPDLQALADYTAEQLLGVSAADAFAMLERGDLEGKAAEWPLLAIQRLIRH